MTVGTSCSALLQTNSRAAGGARVHARAACAGITSRELADDVTLAVSELVTNAVRHGRGEIRLDLRVDPAHVLVSVWDAGDSFQWKPEAADADAIAGRGLGIVSALADECGVRDISATGKSVWCVINEALPSSN